jgi:anti-sigma B factor antagonist
MEIKVLKNDEGIYIIQLFGSLDLYNSNQFKDLVMKMIEKKNERFIIDLKEVTAINSAGIGALIYVSSTIKKMDFRLALANINPAIGKAIETIKLSSYLPIVSSLQEAVALIRSQG